MGGVQPIAVDLAIRNGLPRSVRQNDGVSYIADAMRARLEFPDQRQYIVSRLREEENTEHGIEEALHGQAFVQELWREEKLSRAAFRGIRVKGDKLTRALSWANRAEAGKVVLVRGGGPRRFWTRSAASRTGRTMTK